MRRTHWGRLALIVVAMLLVWWHALIFFCSWTLLPANDFGRMYSSAALFLDGQDMYRWTLAASAKMSEDYVIDLYNMNPPHFHLILLPLALLDNPDYAFALWWVLSGLCLFYAGKWTLAEIGLEPTPAQRQTALVLILAFSGTANMIFTGQVSFVLLVPVTLMWLAARRGLWCWSGALLGVSLSIKPFLGVLLAYLCWQRRWRAAACCLIVTSLCFAIGLLVFGWDNHVAWYQKLGISKDWAWLSTNASLMGMLTRTFSESIYCVSVTALSSGAVWLLWVGIGGILGLLTLQATGRGDGPEGVDQDFCLLLVASILFSPLGWIYYVWLAMPPLVALLSRGWPLRAATNTDAAEQRRWPRWLMWVMLVTLLCPPPLIRLFQPEVEASPRASFATCIREGRPLPLESLATLTIANVYSWGLLAMWTALLASGFSRKKRMCGDTSLRLAPLHPSDYRVSVVMPVYSETDTVRQITEWLLRELGPHLHEIILVQSPRSSEASRVVCRRLTEDYPQVLLHVQRDNPGLGRAVREGFSLATGNLVLTIDSDGEMEIETVPRLLAEMAAGGYALVAASRWLLGGGFIGYSRLKYHLNWCFQQLFRWLFWTQLHDLTYGFKLIRAELVRGIDWQGTLHEIACETTLKPIRLGAAVAEVPSKWTARTQGVSKNTFWRNFRYVRMAGSILVNRIAFSPKRREQPEHPRHIDGRSVVGVGVALPGTTISEVGSTA